MLLADEEAASEVRLGRAREPRDAGKENPFTWLGYPVHLDCGAARPFDFKTQTTRVKYWLAAKLLFRKNQAKRNFFYRADNGVKSMRATPQSYRVVVY